MKFSTWFKKGFIQLIVLGLGVIIALGFGFNKGFDFTGGTIATVNIGSTSRSDARTKLNDLLNSYKNIQLVDITFGTVNNDNVAVIKYKIETKIDSTNENIKNGLYYVFGYDKTDIVQQKYVIMSTELGNAFDNSVFVYALFATIVLSVGCAVYLWLRFNFATAMSMITAVIIDTMMLLSLVLITRIQIGSSISIAIFVTAILSVVMNYFSLQNVNSNVYKEENKKTASLTLADNVEKEMGKIFSVFVLSVIFCMIILMCIVSGELYSSLVAICLGVLSIFITALYVTPYLWAISFRRKAKLIKPTKILEVEE